MTALSTADKTIKIAPQDIEIIRGCFRYARRNLRPVDVMKGAMFDKIINDATGALNRIEHQATHPVEYRPKMAGMPLGGAIIK